MACNDGNEIVALCYQHPQNYMLIFACIRKCALVNITTNCSKFLYKFVYEPHINSTIDSFIISQVHESE